MVLMCKSLKLHPFSPLASPPNRLIFDQLFASGMVAQLREGYESKGLGANAGIFVVIKGNYFAQGK